MINTIYGEMDERNLQKKTGAFDDDNEHTEWIEYWNDGELVHRSAHVQIKQGASSGVIAGVFS
jgi:hypothetical protein